MVKAIAEGATVEHTTKAATVTATDQGEFTAIAATYSVDRQNDQIVRGAFATHLAAADAAALREKALRIARENAPIQTATFEC